MVRMSLVRLFEPMSASISPESIARVRSLLLSQGLSLPRSLLVSHALAPDFSPLPTYRRTGLIPISILRDQCSTSIVCLCLYDVNIDFLSFCAPLVLGSEKPPWKMRCSREGGERHVGHGHIKRRFPTPALSHRSLRRQGICCQETMQWPSPPRSVHDKQRKACQF